MRSPSLCLLIITVTAAAGTLRSQSVTAVPPHAFDASRVGTVPYPALTHPDFTPSPGAYELETPAYYEAFFTDRILVGTLPKFEGLHPAVPLVAGAITRFKFGDSVRWHFEGYRSMNPFSGRYRENWVFLYPKRMPKLSLGFFVASGARNNSAIGSGIRISVF